ncbi:MAG: MATE family efflux transporter [Clostridium butyricum]|nr:MATE family efflux transporter [Clostridium butyricum]
MDIRTRMLSEEPFKLMMTLSLPAIIGMVVIGLYNFMDAVFVGQMVGPEAMTAVKVSYPFTLINNGIATLIGVGSASVLSRAIGEKDKKTIDKIMGNLIISVLILSIIVTLIGSVFTRQLLSLCGAEGEIMEQAIMYLRIVFMGSIFVNFAQAANMVMRGEGILKQAMVIMGIGAMLNIVLDPIIINIMNSQDKGICGAAYATVISQVIQAMITMWYFIKKSKNVRIHTIKFDVNIMKQVLGVGVSAMLMQIMMLVQQTLMYSTAQKYGGSEWQTVLGAALSLQAFAFIPLWGISQGFQPAIGTNYGAKEYDRVGKITKAFVIGATALALIFYVPIMSAPKQMLSFFITDSNIVDLGIGSLKIFFVTYITLGFVILSITLFQALGKGGKAALLTLLRQVILYIPLVLILPRISSIGVKGVFIAGTVTDFGILLLSIVMVAFEFKKIREQNVLQMDIKNIKKNDNIKKINVG